MWSEAQALETHCEGEKVGRGDGQGGYKWEQFEHHSEVDGCREVGGAGRSFEEGDGGRVQCQWGRRDCGSDALIGEKYVINSC